MYFLSRAAGLERRAAWGVNKGTGHSNLLKHSRKKVVLIFTKLSSIYLIKDVNHAKQQQKSMPTSTMHKALSPDLYTLSRSFVWTLPVDFMVCTFLSMCLAGWNSSSWTCTFNEAVYYINFRICSYLAMSLRWVF